jgi:hypothetical protein
LQRKEVERDLKVFAFDFRLSTFNSVAPGHVQLRLGTRLTQEDTPITRTSSRHHRSGSFLITALPDTPSPRFLPYPVGELERRRQEARHLYSNNQNQSKTESTTEHTEYTERENEVKSVRARNFFPTSFSTLNSLNLPSPDT